MSDQLLLKRSNSKLNYFILITVIIAAGLSQGLLLPVLSILLEQKGVSSSLNGLNAAALYVGSFAMTLVAERVLGAIGFKRLIAAGISLVLVTLLLFPLLPGIKVWFILRLLVGIGDSAINYAAQLWVLLMAPAEHRGRNLSLYGMSYGLGFSLGPAGISLLRFGEAAPFLILAGLFMLALLLVLFKLPNSRPDKVEHSEGQARRFGRSYSLAWYALIPALLYGYMEASLNSNFPVYGLRSGFTTDQIATLLPFAGIGGLLLQLPLGLWSDEYGRKKILIFAGTAGGLAFTLLPLAGGHFVFTLLLLLAAGGLVGSFFSLGLSYAADILPRNLLPAANVVSSFHFSIGSIIGPGIGGLLLEFGWGSGVFVLLGGFYILFGLTGLLFSPQQMN
ncbi:MULTISPECIES: MFS transporter [unclassified Paenibacillus]|uniref:MFS transporter n=1 Tax=unclassified Paenibacillus TaxID=185978 RepID=UPI002406D061|nr:MULTISPECIES: MFS transporter [unclassified Paenibacillus]MDF9841107.1 MFS family permease [Paenibacillus sp. PastF-2]MDF9847721.1 MFS family permease [Paenibacillus sp. PastM-2]MDF9854290.1 MFS family permease [Paenibacillus sp. PastF-1]MDH6479539.1 MFS family permease [Paenibacillus sp. PastH-2]MDH6505204.1 MFS family permease [Paenibacillus sp. PastM-3]